jgi:hypothetical protein
MKKLVHKVSPANVQVTGEARLTSELFMKVGLNEI